MENCGIDKRLLEQKITDRINIGRIPILESAIARKAVKKYHNKGKLKVIFYKKLKSCFE